MSGTPSVPWTLDPELRSILVCPVCRGDLDDEPEGLLCRACHKLYPVVDNVPWMVPEAAISRGN